MRTWLETDFGLMEKNLNTVRGVLPQGCDVIAVIKANAYGHGVIPVAKKLTELGVGRFAVACMDEALEVRCGGIAGGLIVLGNTEPKDAKDAAENDVTLACTGPASFEALRKAAQGLKKPLKVHIAINTGMNRIGFDCRTEEQLNAIAAAYRTANGDPASPIRVTGIFSHFSSADDTSAGADPYTKLQLSRFEAVLAHLEKCGIDPGLRHISNSGGIGKYPQARFDAVRCGALIYGYNTAFDAKLPVVPVMQWKTAVTVIRQIDKGDAVSYSRKFIADGPRTIATVGVGYADGLSRSLSNKGFVLVKGHKVPMVGNICMDQMMIDITEIQLQAEKAGDPNAFVKIGDEVILIGRSGDLVQTADDIAEVQGSCMHEVVSTIGARVERYYK
jgi:alanine racemase